MLLFIAHIGAPSDVKGVNTVMAGLVTAGIVNSASGHNHHFRPLFHIEIIVDNIGHPGSYHHRNMYLFTLCLFVNVNINALPVFLGADFDVFAVPVAQGTAVVAHIVRTFLLKSRPVNHLQYLIYYRIQLHSRHPPFRRPCRRSHSFPETV